MPLLRFGTFDPTPTPFYTSGGTGTCVGCHTLSTDDSTLVFVVPASGTIAMAGDTHFKLGTLWTASVDFKIIALGSPAQVLGSTADTYYYPAFSPDKSFIVFDDAPDAPDTATSNGDDFYNRNARVKLLHYPPSAGAKPVDLPNLNVADGLTNSWPRWSPFPTSFHGHSVYWVTFSSNRDYGLHLVNAGFDNCYPPEGPSYDQPQPLSKQNVTYENCAEPQIWMAAVVVDPDTSLDAKDRSYPAFWLPFQDVSAHNHSAQWAEKIQTPPGTDGGTNPGDGGPGQSCGEPTSACSGAARCCSDAVCCDGQCQYDCVFIH